MVWRVRKNRKVMSFNFATFFTVVVEPKIVYVILNLFKKIVQNDVVEQQKTAVGL